MRRTLFAIPLLTLSLAAQGWVDRTPSNPSASPSPRRGAAMCWDAAHNYMLMVGGYVTQGGLGADTWSWNGTSWSPVGPPLTAIASVAAGIQDGAMAFHPPTNEVVLVWQGVYCTWTGSGWIQRGQLPNPQSGTPCYVAMSRDTTRGETVLFVGGRYVGNITPTAETYVWDGFVWSPRTTSTRPGPIGQTSMAFDPVTSRLLLQVTSSTASTYWEWTGTNWLQRFYPGAPARGGAMATDPGANRIVMFDGVLDGQPNHTWTIGGTSMQLRGTVAAPAQRSEAAMAFDPVRGKVVMFGGYNGLELGDTWEFTPGSDASYTTFGTGCAGTRGTPSLAAQTNSLPRIGQTFSLQIGNLPFQGTPFLFLGFSNTDFGGTPLPFSLGLFGAPGCDVLCSGDQTFLLPNLLGTSVWNVPVPNLPGAQFYNQVFVFDAGANPFGVTASNAGSGVVGL